MRTRDRIALLTLVLVALLAAAPLWGPGMVNTRGGGDSPFLLQRTHQLVENLQAGIFPVRWMPDGAYGLGYPFFSYYAALPYYLAGALVLIGVDILTALKLVQTWGFIAAALGMYGWMRRMSRSRKVAWLAAVAYTVAPFHLVNVYVRGDSLSEFYAFVFYPLILWGLDGIGKCANQQTNKSANLQVAAVALAYAGLLLTHNISAAIFSPFALLYLIALAWHAKERRWRVLGTGALALGLGMLLSAWFWLPAVAELKYVQLGPSTAGFFHYSRHFRGLNLVQRRVLFDYATDTDHQFSSPFAMGLAQAILAALGGLVLIRRMIRRQLEPRWWAVLAGLLLSTAMVTPLSKPLWDHLPVLPVVQFPWRFLSVQALFTAAVTGWIADYGPALSDESQVCVEGAQIVSRHAVRHKSSSFIVHWSLIILTAALLIASTLLSLRPDRLYVGPADVTVERLQLYELFTQNIGTTIRYEWLPNTVDPRPYTSDKLAEPDAPLQAIPLQGASIEAQLLERATTRQTWQVQGTGSEIVMPLVFWPGWQAQVDGEPTEAWPVGNSGYLALAVPSGEHIITLRLGRTPVRTAAEVTSLVALLALAAVVVRSRAASRQISKSFVAHCSLLILCPLIFLLMPHTVPTTDSDLAMDFIQMPYLHHNPEGVPFGDDVWLMGYQLSTETPAPGGTLTIDLNWSHVEGPYTATVRLVSPAAVRHEELEPLAEQTASLSPSPPISLSLPEDLSRGLYLLQLRVFGPQGEINSHTATGAPQGTLYLRPVRVPRGPTRRTDAPILAPFGPDIRLHAATITQPAPDRLAVQLAWSVMQPTAVNYAISLRLVDADGQQRVALDTPHPGYGFLPTSAWRPGELVTDRYTLVLPDDLPPESTYRLHIVLYRKDTMAVLGQAQVGAFALPLGVPFEAQPPPRTFQMPDLTHPVGVTFGEEIALAGYELAQEEPALHLTLWWQALQAPRADYTIFVHLFDPATNENVVQSDAQPRGGTYPTSRWTAGEVVSETVTLPLGKVPPGAYQLAVGLYDQTVTRLPAIGPDSQPIPDGRVILPAEVRVEP